MGSSMWIGFLYRWKIPPPAKNGLYISLVLTFLHGLSQECPHAWVTRLESFNESSSVIFINIKLFTKSFGADTIHHAITNLNVSERSQLANIDTFNPKCKISILDRHHIAKHP